MSATVSIKTANALRAHRNANGDGKKLLENLIGKEVFENQDVRDRIKSFEDARLETGRPDVPDFSHLPKDMREHYEALYKMEVITKSLNEGWKPNWDNGNEYKWYPWFVMSPSGFAFADARYDDSDADAGCGSRLRYKTEALAKYSAAQFLDVWKKIQLG